MAVVARTVGDVVAEIIMTRTAFRGSLFILEGVNDAKFWKFRLAPRDQCDLVIAGSKPTAISALLHATSKGNSGLLAAVDDDYDSVRGTPISSPHLVRTDTRDIETLMLRTTALDRVLFEVGDHKKIDALEKIEGRSIRDALIARARIFGELRYLSVSNGWSVDFRELSPYRFTDIPTWTVDERAFLGEVAAQAPGISVAQLQSLRMAIPRISPWSLLHGKDTLCVLAAGLKQMIGNQSLNVDRLSQLLRLAFDDALLKATKIYTSIKKWESINTPYRVLLP